MSEAPQSMTSGDAKEEKVAVTLPGTVEKIIKPLHPSMPEQAQIVVEGAAELYREIRIENTLTDKDGEKVKLKPGTDVEVTVEAPADEAIPQSDKKEEGGEVKRP